MEEAAHGASGSRFNWRLFFLAAVLVALLWALVWVPFRPDRGIVPESAAVGRLRMLHTVQEQYASSWEKGYATSLEELGRVELIDPQLASGEANGYLFELAPGPEDAAGQVTTYTVRARPKVFGDESRASFLIDQTGHIRVTKEDRAATTEDREVR